MYFHSLFPHRKIAQPESYGPNRKVPVAEALNFIEEMLGSYQKLMLSKPQIWQWCYCYCYCYYYYYYYFYYYYYYNNYYYYNYYYYYYTYYNNHYYSCFDYFYYWILFLVSYGTLSHWSWVLPEYFTQFTIYSNPLEKRETFLTSFPNNRFQKVHWNQVCATPNRQMYFQVSHEQKQPFWVGQCGWTNHGSTHSGAKSWYPRFVLLGPWLWVVPSHWVSNDNSLSYAPSRQFWQMKV